METKWKCHDSTELLSVQIFFLTLRGGSKRSRGILVDSLHNEMSKRFPLPTSCRSQPRLLFPKESGIIILHLRFASLTGQVPSSPPRGLEVGGPRSPGQGSGVPRVSLPPARIRLATPLPQPPSPEGALGPQPFKLARVPPRGSPRRLPVTWAQSPEGVSVPRRPASSERPPARAASPARRPSPGPSRPLPQPILPASGHAAQKPPTPKAGPDRTPRLSSGCGGGRRQWRPQVPAHPSIHPSTRLSCISLPAHHLPIYVSIDLSIYPPTPTLLSNPSSHAPSVNHRSLEA